MMATTKQTKTSKKVSSKDAAKKAPKSASSKIAQHAAGKTSKDTVKKTPQKPVKSVAPVAGKSPSKKTVTDMASINNAPTKKRAQLIASLKERLLQERDILLKGMQRKETPNEISTHGDLVDQSTNFSEHEVMLGMAEHDRNRLQEINRALDKIKNGTYGICEMSGELISDERLIAMPTARYSVKCQAKIEGYS